MRREDWWRWLIVAIMFAFPAAVFLSASHLLYVPTLERFLESFQGIQVGS